MSDSANIQNPLGPPLDDEFGAAEEVEQEQTLVELLVEFDFAPYLDGAALEAWLTLQGYPILFAIVLIAIGYGIGWVLKSVIHRLLDIMAKSHYSEVDYQIAHFLSQPVLQTTVTLAMVMALATLDFPGAIEHMLISVCFTVLLILWGRAWFKATTVILKALEEESDRFHAFHSKTTPLYEMGIKLALLGLFIYFFFIVWGINPTAWFASAGIIGIAVGFAARDTLANLISGVSIVADAPYKIGDFIVLDTGERGLVTQLGIRSTRLLTRDDVEVSIPNAIIGTAKIINESGGPYVRHRFRMRIGVAYHSDMDLVIKILKEIAADDERVVDEPHPRIRIRNFGDNAIEFDFMCWIRRPADRGVTIHFLYMEIIKRFREAGIEIPFPQRDLYLKSVPDEDESGAGSDDSDVHPHTGSEAYAESEPEPESLAQTDAEEKAKAELEAQEQDKAPKPD